ncbi:hypothetical protein D3C81_1765860 [compost metagenome]
MAGTFKGSIEAGDAWIMNDSNKTGGGYFYTPTKVKEYKLVGISGSVRVKFVLQVARANSTVNAQIYFNGIARGIVRTHTGTYDWHGMSFTEDFNVNDGDLIQIYTWAAGGHYSSVYSTSFGVTSPAISLLYTSDVGYIG